MSMARRLTEDREFTVAVLKAGPDYGQALTAWPAELIDPSEIVLGSHSWTNACVWLRGSDRSGRCRSSGSRHSTRCQGVWPPSSGRESRSQES